MQFLIIGRDGNDVGAPARRQTSRPAHLDALAPRRAAGEILQAGALLNEDGDPVGSAVVAEFSDRRALDAWLAAEPYVKAGVWQTVEVTPLRLLSWD